MGHVKGGGGAGSQKSEGADVATTTLANVALVATGTGLDAGYSGWTCTACPGSGDIEFPTGTTTSAVNAAIADASAASTTVTLPGPGRYEFRAAWTDGTTETMTVRATRPSPACGLSFSSGGPSNGVVTGGGSFVFVLADANSADSATFSAAVVKMPGGASVSLSESPEGTFAGTWPAQVSTGLSLRLTGTTTDGHGRTATTSAAYLIEGVNPTPPVLTDPAVSTITIGAADPSRTFTNAGGSVASSSASVLEGPAGHGATVTHSSGSLAVTLTGPDKPGTYVIQYTATNSDGSAIGRAVFVVGSAAPTADAGALVQTHSGSAVTLDGSGSSVHGSSSGSLTFAWSILSGAGGSLNDAAIAGPQFSPADSETAYLLQLVVTDSSNGETDSAIKTVAPAGAKQILWSHNLLSDITDDASLADGDNVLADDGSTVRLTTKTGIGLQSGAGTSTASVAEATGWRLLVNKTGGSFTYAYLAHSQDVSSVDFHNNIIVVEAIINITAMSGGAFDTAMFMVSPDGEFRKAGSATAYGAGIWSSGSMNERAVAYTGTNANFDSSVQRSGGGAVPRRMHVQIVIADGIVFTARWRSDSGSGLSFPAAVLNESNADTYKHRWNTTFSETTATDHRFSGGALFWGVSAAAYANGTTTVDIEQVQAYSLGPGSV